ncbi:hypothetical protein SERLA73DRAFT_90841 [Serpula lacrymans var. lacrymans S7.3]|uniref:Decapping nuclease n=2 Tax=Serpula lacrymans var. lacrymans TaxID=341189 RepID=F8PXH2_SERL3|nr:uncharacterized protein SERLADRAFT_415895 [Serpula lacrymans var. lacrymans S7.9]EGN99498.1 hypothetical protein SERLA73DRAFT_90841 [Serpula lacrymans var. lacrymans S7.3]EGO25052.1 hypothetical protein SERLADRAFT_415895 [Serpula lacrymans var. lacrymans S7.9]
MATKRKASEFLVEGEQDPRSFSRIRAQSPIVSEQNTPSNSPHRFLAYSAPSQKPIHPPTFQQPTQLLTFSYTPERQLEFTDSAMRYFVEPPRGANLGNRYENWVRRPDERGRVDGLLRAWSKAKAKIANSGDGTKGQPSDIGVIAWRGVMTKILTAAYEERDGWELNVMCMNGTMYFEEHLSDAKLKEKNAMEPRHRRQTYYGYAFESYCTSSTPHKQEDCSADTQGWSGDVNTNVQWCSVVKTKLGDTRIIIGGEVDCVREKYTGRPDTFVELKTSLSIRGPHDEAKFEKKLLKFYFQSFLLGVPEIIVGFRTPSGYITTTQTFKTLELPRLVRGKPGAWDPVACLDWGRRFLSFLKDTMASSAARDVWRVKFTPREGVSVALLDEAGVADVEGGEARVGFLPRWYWDKEIGSEDAIDDEDGRGTIRARTTVVRMGGQMIIASVLVRMGNGLTRARACHCSFNGEYVLASAAKSGYLVII